MRRSITSLALLACLIPSTHAPAAISIDGSVTQSEVSDGLQDITNTAMSTGGTVVIATLPGGYFSQTTTNFSASGNSGLLSAIFDQTRGGDPGGGSVGLVLAVFTTDVSLPYSAAGDYTNSGGRTLFYNLLADVTTNQLLYYSEQNNSGSPVSLTLGGAGGNGDNLFFGSLSGTLPANHQFEWLIESFTAATGEADGGAVAGGSLSLTIGAAAVPEFSSAIVWSMLVMTIGGAFWWQRFK